MDLRVTNSARSLEGRRKAGQGSRNHAAINEDAGLESGQLGVIAVVLCVLAGLGSAPAVDRDVERGARLESGNEASHDRHTKGGTAVGEVGVRDNMAVDLEFLQGHSIVSAGGEEQHVPIVVSHPEVEPEVELARGSKKSKGEKTAQYCHMERAEDGAAGGVGRNREEKKEVEVREEDEGMRELAHKESLFEEMMVRGGGRMTISLHGRRIFSPEEKQE